MASQLAPDVPWLQRRSFEAGDWMVVAQGLMTKLATDRAWRRAPHARRFSRRNPLWRKARIGASIALLVLATTTACSSSQAHTDGQDGSHSSLTTFQVPRIGGGELTAASYRGSDLVIVTGRAVQIRALIDRILPMTRGGKSPAVIGLLKFDDFGNWKGSLLNPSDEAALVKSISASLGTFKVPVGIDFKGALAGQVTATDDPENQGTHAVLIDTSGKLVRVAPSTATDDKLAGWIGDLS